MSQTETRQIEVVPFADGFGAEIRGVSLRGPLAGPERAVVEDAFLTHHVLAFRGQQGLEPDDVVEASRLFGDDLEPHVFKQYHHPETPLILVLSNRRGDGGEEKGLKDAGTFWHSDVTFKTAPAKATLLYAVEVPDDGGDTLFCDMEAAYEALSDDMKARLDGLTATHFYAHQKRDLFERGEVTSPPPVSHPVVRTNPGSGKKALYVNPAYVTGIDGLDEAESAALLEELFAHCLSDRFRMRYKWQAGDMLVWDNAAVMHSATTKDLDPAKHRTIWRTIISGGPTF